MNPDLSHIKKLLESNTYSRNHIYIPRVLVPEISPYLFWRDTIGLSRALSLYRSVGNISDLKTKKQSETLAILGSGASINEMDDSDFQFLSGIDTLALNWWGAYHDFVPDFYAIEFGPTVLKHWIPRMNEKADLYSKKDVTLVFDPEKAIGHQFNMAEQLDRINDGIFNSHIEMRLCLYFARSESDFSNLTKFFFPTCPLTNRLLHYRGSLSHAIALGVYLGYSDIILFGIDLNNSKYFFSDHPNTHKVTDHGKSEDEYHATAERNEFKPIDEYIRHLSNQVFEGENKLYIGSKSSLLYPTLPYFQDGFEY